MKIPSFIAAILTATAFAAHAEISPVHMTVELISKSAASTAAKGQPSAGKTQTQSLKIQLDNSSTKESFDSLVVKYWFFGHGMTEHGTKVLVEGERKASLAPRAKELVESEIVTKQSTEAHASAPVKGKTGGGGAGAGASNRVPATGEKLTGHAVRLMKDGKMIAEYYSDSSLKAILDKPAAAAPAPSAAVGAKPGAKPAPGK